MKRPSRLTLLAGALLLLMPAIALLQFRWVGQVSDAEQERMQRNVSIAAIQFGESFNGEIRSAANNLSVNQQTARDAQWERYATRYDEWLNNDAVHPLIVKGVYLVDADNGTVDARRWDNEAKAFQQGPWPPSLAPWRADFEAEFDDWRAARMPPEPRTRFQGQDALILSPLVGRPINVNPAGRLNPTVGSRQQTSETVFGFTVIELDLQYIQRQLLPDLTLRHFRHRDSDSYRVSVLDSDEPTRVIFRSEPDSPIVAANADATEPFFRRGGPRDPRPPAANERRGQNDPPPFQGRWLLLVQHPSGSLDAAVRAARWRNLTLSFGVLMLLTVSIGLLTVTSRRSQRLAKQQMEFVAGVSHELRTPVAVIQSAAENLAQGVVGNTDRVKRYGQMIEGEARRLGEMVERVLQYAGIESGLGYGARSPLAPAEIIDSAIDSALPLLGPETVDVHREIAENLPAVIGDAAALRSAVHNLVANAVKYGGKDRWVGVRAEHVRHHRRSEVHITVKDHGPGIPANELPHIFDPFYRGNEALSQQIHGNGLGLSLVKRIVAAHGGQVTVVTRAGAGSAFTIVLPAAAPDTSSTSVTSGVRAPVHS